MKRGDMTKQRGHNETDHNEETKRGSVLIVMDSLGVSGFSEIPFVQK